jgi:hypothetical protein
MQIGHAYESHVKYLFEAFQTLLLMGVVNKTRARARSKGWDVHELATGHDAMLTAPRELAKILIELAR